MDNPGMSIFQDGGINIENNSQNQEEAEDLEEQLRRREELQNLLTNALDDFKYDDSTINSSTNVSIASVEQQATNQLYKEAITPSEQLKVLYDVRVREINNLREEFNNFKIEKSKEFDVLKSQSILYEAEVHHLQVSLKNAESLLAERTDCINKMKADLESRDKQIEKLNRDLENFEIEICAYKSTVHGLQLKIDNESNPYYKGAKQFESEELQNAHQQQILRLEMLIEEHTKRNEILERDKRKLSDELRNVIESKKVIDSEAKNAVFCLTQSLNSAQNQCHDLLDIVEALTKENEHLRDRIKQTENSTFSTESTTSFKGKNMSPTTLNIRLEKMKQLLLDKEIELQTLKTKTKFYEEDVKELLEYRKIKSDVSNFDFNACGDTSNNQKLIILQNEVQTLKTSLGNKEKEIATLDVINKELEGKIEEMLLQTRTEIQNISHKYSLPQLEVMSADLNNAQDQIKMLESQIELNKLEKSQFEELYAEAKTNVSNLEKQVERLGFQVHQLENALKNAETDLKSAQNQISHLQEINVELEATNKSQESELKGTITELRTSKSVNKELQKQLTNALTELENNKADNKITTSPSRHESIENEQLKIELSEAQKQVRMLEETVQEMTNMKAIMEGERHNLEYQLNDVKNELDGYQTKLKNYDEKLTKFDDMKVDIQTVEKELFECNRIIKNYQENKTAMEKEIETLTTELKISENEILNLTKAIEELHKLLEKTNQKADSNGQKNLQAEVLKSELKVREKLQEEYSLKVDKIEKRYNKVCKENTEKYKAEIEKLKIHENNYRTQIGQLLSEWAPKVTELEKTNEDLQEQIKSYETLFMEIKLRAQENEDKLIKLVEKTKCEATASVDMWKNWTKMVVGGCLEVEKINCKSRDKVVKSIDAGNAQVAAVEKLYEEKIKRLKKKQ